MSSGQLEGRVALVTGASRGIGRSIALALARAGAHVIAVARTQGALEELDDEILAGTGARATLVPMDLCKSEGIDALGLAIHKRWGHLDILVHAAALLGGLTPSSHIEPKTWDRVMAVNLTASYRLIRSLEPLLLRSSAGRAVMVSSSVAVRPRAFWGPYAASKAGLEALVRCWADETGTTPLRVCILDPGAMRTRLRAEAFPGEDPHTLPHPDEIVPFALELVRADADPPIRAVFREWKAAQVPEGGAGQ